MKNSMKIRIALIAAAATLGLSAFALAGSREGAPNSGAPMVTSTSPTNRATGVPINSNVTATFTKSMDPATINTTSFTVTATGAAAVAGTVTLDAAGKKATFTPSGTLAANTAYTASITTMAKDQAWKARNNKHDNDNSHKYNNRDDDQACKALAAAYVWTFTTGATPNTTVPAVISTTPANTVTGVCLNNAINATFSEAMDPATITTATFTVAVPGAAATAGTITYNAATNIATFTPTAALAAGTQFTATIIGGAGGATNLAGTALANDHAWTFTTAAQACSTATPVALGAAGPFAAFGGAAGITNQGILTLINGDIGTTAASTLITGFHDSTGAIYTETPLNIGTVNGTIYTAPPAPGTAATFVIATQAAADALTAFNSLSPASLPGGTDPFAGLLGGNTVPPGVYQSASGSFQITGSDLILDARGDANAVWVFQMATSLTVGDTAPRSVILINGAQAKNVFWQVGSAATINGAGGGTMVGTIIASAGVTFSTAGNVAVTTLNGRALGLNASVTMVNTNINVPAP